MFVPHFTYLHPSVRSLSP